MVECSDYYYSRFVCQLITYNSVLFGFTLSITHLIQGAFYAFKTETISVLGLWVGLYVLELSQLLKGVYIGRV